MLLDKSSSLWNYLNSEQKDFVADAGILLEQAKSSSRVLTDYSYLVFPVAKTYEGFLKKIFLDLTIINEAQYNGEHFRIGKALNPFIEPHLRAESYYDKICKRLGTDLTNALWDQWKKGRNLLFHYFPNHLTCLRLTEAEKIIHDVLAVMERAVRESGVLAIPINVNFQGSSL